MEFSRKKKRGMNGKTHKVWLSSCGQYRITWTREVVGVSVTPHYHACVRCYAEPRGDVRFWHFVGRRGSYKKLSAAIEACEKHERLWKHAIEISEGERTGRADRMRAAVARSKVGTGTSCQHILTTLPVWVRKHAKLVNQLFPPKSCRTDSTADLSEPSPNGPTEHSPTTEPRSSDGVREESSLTELPTPGPARDAAVTDESTTRTTRPIRSKGTGTEMSSTARPVMEPAASAVNSLRQRTARSSASTSTTRKSTKRSSKPRKSRSRS